MLGDELNVPKRLDLSRSSFMDDELDSKRTKCIIFRPSAETIGKR
jgi:hypothetical protein